MNSWGYNWSSVASAGPPLQEKGLRIGKSLVENFWDDHNRGAYDTEEEKQRETNLFKG